MKKTKLKVVKNCGGKKGRGCSITIFDPTIAKTFETMKKAA